MNRSLFPDPSGSSNPRSPLAERLRPQSLPDVLGQDHLTAPGRVLFEMVAQRRLSSFVLWGPPGSGKTSLAKIVAQEVQASFIAYSAVLSGIKEIKSVMATAERSRSHSTGGTVYLCRRDSSFQQGSARCLSTLHRIRDHHPDRGHHGKPFF